MPYIFCINKNCEYHEEFSFILLEPVGEGFEYEELVVGMDGKKRPVPKKCRKCGWKIFLKCPNQKCGRQLDYWPPQRCEGCGLDFNSVSIDLPKTIPQLPTGK
jgi:hypothetical protein